MRILITGGAGFIGSHTADQLVRAGYRVRVLDNLHPQVHGPNASFPAYLHPDVECIRGDVRNPRDVARALDGVEAVYHLAALTGVGQSMYAIRSYVDVNVTGTATLLEALLARRAHIRRVVLASSRAVYGEGSCGCPRCGTVYPGVRPKDQMEAGNFEIRCPRCGGRAQPVPTAEERPLRPVSVYGWTKKEQEELCRMAATTWGLPVTILRYFNVYGSRQSLKNPYTGIVSIFFSRIRAGNPVSLYERGLPVRDFVHVKDVARANLLALEAAVPPGTCINIGSGRPVTVRNVADALGAALGRAPRILDRGEFRVGDIFACYADVSRARDFLGYAPGISLEEGMREFAGWASEEPAEDRYEHAVEELRQHGLFGRAGGEGR